VASCWLLVARIRSVRRPFNDGGEEAVARMDAGQEAEKGAVQQRVKIVELQLTFSAQPLQLQSRVARAKVIAVLKHFIDYGLILFRLERTTGVHQATAGAQPLQRRA